MIGSAIYVLIFLLAPAAVLRACRKVTILGKIGPVLPLYILGLILGNVWKSAGLPGILAVCLAVVAGYFIFGKNIPDGHKIGGMLTGVYTGGTINLAALKSMLGVSEETYILLNSYDMIISFLFLIFLMSCGIRLFRKILPVETFEAATGKEMEEIQKEIDKAGENPYKGLFTKSGLKDAGFLLGLTLVIVGISAGLALLAGDSAFMVVLILMLTTLGIAASFIPSVKTKRYGYDIGMYFIYIFCIVVASMADISKLDLASGASMLGYLTLVIFGSLILQVIFARILKIDSDTMVISSVAFICSPPFVPMMTAAMKNRRVLVAGLSIGIIGYAAGNYLGFLISRLLPLLRLPAREHSPKSLINSHLPGMTLGLFPRSCFG